MVFLVALPSLTQRWRPESAQVAGAASHLGDGELLMELADCIQELISGRELRATRNSHADNVDLARATRRLPRWIELIPAGVFNGRDGRGPYRNERPAQVIAATRALGMTAGLPIDFDHAIDLGAPQGHPALAAGWIKELRQVNGAIQGRVEWTAAGVKALAAKLYRYISPVFEFAGDGAVQRLLRAAVTNNPNLHLKAIASAETANNLDDRYSRALDRIRQFEALPNATNRRVARIALTRTTELASSRFLTPGELELCRSQGINFARFALARRERTIGRPLVMETRAISRREPHDATTPGTRASAELGRFLRNPTALESLRHLLYAELVLAIGHYPDSPIGS